MTSIAFKQITESILSTGQLSGKYLVNPATLDAYEVVEGILQLTYKDYNYVVFCRRANKNYIVLATLLIDCDFDRPVAYFERVSSLHFVDEIEDLKCVEGLYRDIDVNKVQVLINRAQAYK
jgi:hypothetical protein